MYSVEADTKGKLIVITGTGAVTKNDVEAVARKIREILQDLAPGFVLLCDFRWMTSMDPGATPLIAAIMDMLAERRVRAVVRVLPDPRKDIGFNILSLFHYGPETEILTFETLAEAIQNLPASEASIKA
jgi:hypothetical protein